MGAWHWQQLRDSENMAGLRLAKSRENVGKARFGLAVLASAAVTWQMDK